MSYPLTPQGVADQLAALYALSDSALDVQANAIRNDFREWVIDHFTLSNDQKNYLNGLPNSSTKYFGDQCWFCFVHRLQITFVYPSPPTTSARVGKWTDCTSSTKLVADDNGGNTATGSITFTIEYRSL